VQCQEAISRWAPEEAALVCRFEEFVSRENAVSSVLAARIVPGIDAVGRIHDKRRMLIEEGQVNFFSCYLISGGD
jgi:hypothetical protein